MRQGRAQDRLPVSKEVKKQRGWDPPEPFSTKASFSLPLPVPRLRPCTFSVHQALCWRRMLCASRVSFIGVPQLFTGGVKQQFPGLKGVWTAQLYEITTNFSIVIVSSNQCIRVCLRHPTEVKTIGVRENKLVQIKNVAERQHFCSVFLTRTLFIYSLKAFNTSYKDLSWFLFLTHSISALLAILTNMLLNTFKSQIKWTLLALIV